MIYLTLFFISLLAATLVPGGSEALFVYDLTQDANAFLLLIAASIGNTLGSVINYFIGTKGIDYLLAHQYVKKKHIERVSGYFLRFSGWILLFSWTPVLGDPITFIAGVFKYSFKKFLIIVFFAKTVRYTVILWMVI